MIDLDALIEEAVIHGEIAAGTDPRWLAHRHDARMVTALAGRREHIGKAPMWRAEEDEYLRRHYLFQSDADMAAHLGRTAEAVGLRIKRDLALPARSLIEDWPTVREAARRLGVPESRTVGRWAELGLIEIYPLPMGGGRRAVYWPRVVRFAVNPLNWVYFDISRVQDPHLRRLIEHRRQRWDDDWWTTGQVAAYHGVEHFDVQRLILRGEIKAVSWGNWRVLRSEATRPDLVFYKGRGRGRTIQWSPAGDAFLVLGKGLGFSWRALSNMAGFPYMQRAQHRITEMQKLGLIQPTIDAYGLRVQYDEGTGYLLADWRDEAHRRRFRRMATACERFRDGLPLTGEQSNLIAGTIRVWATFYARDVDQKAMARRWSSLSNIATVDYLRDAWNTLCGWGIDPFREEESQ